MSFHIVLLLVLLVFVAIFFRIDFIIYLLYLLAGVYLLALLWTRHTLRAISIQRSYLDHAFLGENVQVQLAVRNRSLLPIPWVRIEDSLPLALSATPLRSALLMAPRQTVHLSYQFAGHRRGIYAIGPTLIRAGDLFGFEEPPQRSGPAGPITIYPLILPIIQLGLSSHSPFGTIVSKQHIFQDPSRSIGVRDYHAGDSLRHINWKVSARQRRLQTRTFEPAISLNTTIMLNLNRTEYHRPTQIDATERAIVAAASVAHHLVHQRQAVGFCTNGRLAPPHDEAIPHIPAEPGKSNLMQVLDMLARVRMVDTTPFVSFLREHSARLPWGNTLLVVTSILREDLLHELLSLRRQGYPVAAICVEPHLDFARLSRQAHYQGITTYLTPHLPAGAIHFAGATHQTMMQGHGERRP